MEELRQQKEAESGIEAAQRREEEQRRREEAEHQKQAEVRKLQQDEKLKDADAARHKDMADMVVVQAGNFLMGCSREDTDCDRVERPGRSVYLDDFLIDKTEVTVSQYTRCMERRSMYQAITRGCLYVGEAKTPDTSCELCGFEPGPRVLYLGGKALTDRSGVGESCTRYGRTYFSMGELLEK